MDDLVAWLRGVLAADEAAARDELLLSKRAQEHPETWQRMLADIEAKRAILNKWQTKTRWAVRHPSTDFGDGEIWGIEAAISLLASAYRDRPGYREEWRP